MLDLASRRVLVMWCLTYLGALLVGCQSANKPAQPGIVFDSVPSSGTGGTGRIETVRGHVLNAPPHLRIVLYAFAGNTWWIQPLTNHPFTNVSANGQWSSYTHLGTKYAALLVKPNYLPANTAQVLPQVTGFVIALVTADGTAPPSGREPKVQFGGYEWKPRQVGSDRNGSPHDYLTSNVNVDSKGYLHLRISKHEARWTCSEVALMRSLGYGHYAFSIRNLSHLEPDAILSVFTWDDAGADYHRRGLALEVVLGENPNGLNAQYIVQPYYRPTNTYRYHAPAGLLTYRFDWQPKEIMFTTSRGIETEASIATLARHRFTLDVPVPKNESIRMNLCTVKEPQATQQTEAEVVVERFSYLP